MRCSTGRRRDCARASWARSEQAAAAYCGCVCVGRHSTGKRQAQIEHLQSPSPGKSSAGEAGPMDLGTGGAWPGRVRRGSVRALKITRQKFEPGLPGVSRVAQQGSTACGRPSCSAPSPDRRRRYRASTRLTVATLAPDAHQGRHQQIASLMLIGGARLHETPRLHQSMAPSISGPMARVDAGQLGSCSSRFGRASAAQRGGRCDPPVCGELSRISASNRW